MKNLFTTFLFFLFIINANAQIDIIHPPNWWVGFENQNLQLLVKGNSISEFEVGIDYARIYLSNDDELVNDTSYTSGTKISTGSSTIEFEWSRYEQFDKFEEFMASIQEVRLLDVSLENLSGMKAAQGVDDVVQLSKLGTENQNGYIIDVGFEQMISLSNDISFLILLLI